MTARFDLLEISHNFNKEVADFLRYKAVHGKYADVVRLLYEAEQKLGGREK